MDEYTNANFIDDEEKMVDFELMLKKDFLASYSYLTEREYDNTLRVYNARKLANALREFAKKPENIDNFENYLENHFDSWLATFVNDSSDLANEFHMFSLMEV